MKRLYSRTLPRLPRSTFTVLATLALGLCSTGKAWSQGINADPGKSKDDAKVGVVGIVRFAFPKVTTDQQLNDFQNTFVALLGSGLGMQGVPTVERNEQILGDIDRELGRRIIGDVDRDTAAQAGRKLGARWVLTGVVEDAAQTGDFARITIRAKLVNVETGVPIELKLAEGLCKISRKKKSFLDMARELVKPVKGNGQPTESLDDIKKTPLYGAIMRASFQLGREIVTIVPPVRGKVLALPGKDEVLINAGVTSGIKPGSKFLIYREEPIMAPDGTVAGYRRKEVGTAEALDGQVDEATSILKLTNRLDESMEIKVGDYARRRPLTNDELDQRLREETGETAALTSKPDKREKKEKN